MIFRPWLMRVLVFIFIFTIEVRIKAAQQEPEQCLSKLEMPCSLFAFSPANIKTKKFDATLAAGSILYREKSGEWNFLSGTLRIATSKTIRLNTKIGLIKLGPGIHWLQWRDDKFWVYALEGYSEMELSATSLQSNFVPEGFVNWFSVIDKTGKNAQGVPTRIELAEAKTFLPGFKKHKDLKLIEKMETRGVAMASDFYREIAQQMQDQAYQRELAAEHSEAMRQDLQKRVRNLFREKYLSPVELPDEDSDSSN